MNETVTSEFMPGLDHVVAAQTRLSSVDGEAGELVIAGFLLEELAANATFEEAVYLLWQDRLPDATQLAEFRATLASYREISPATLDVLRAAAQQKLPAMDALRMAAGTINLRGAGEPQAQNIRRDALALVARFPTIIAAYWRISGS